jgi:hypothetical protein
VQSLSLYAILLPFGLLGIVFEIQREYSIRRRRPILNLRLGNPSKYDCRNPLVTTRREARPLERQPKDLLK